jgi:hypothetical protein
MIKTDRLGYFSEFGHAKSSSTCPISMANKTSSKPIPLSAFNKAFFQERNILVFACMPYDVWHFLKQGAVN